jgi:hypothetical protein
MANVIEFEVFRDYLGVAADAVEIDDVSKLYDAIGSQVRRITRRDFEGDEGGSYDQVIRIREEREFDLPHVPVEAITSIRQAFFDGTEDNPYDAEQWRLEDAARGRIRLLPRAEYVRVVWTTTGEIPAEVPQAFLEWGKTRWDERDRTGGLASYSTGADSESYFATLAGRPPRDVMLALLGVQHSTGGGVV